MHHNRFQEAATYTRSALKTNSLYAALAAGKAIRVTILDKEGQTLEQGAGDDASREYVTQVAGRVRVEALDPAGNVTRREL